MAGAVPTCIQGRSCRGRFRPYSLVYRAVHAGVGSGLTHSYTGPFMRG